MEPAINKDTCQNTTGQSLLWPLRRETTVEAVAAPDQMFTDARATRERLRDAVLRPAPSLRYEDFPREQRKAELEVSEAAARLAAALHLHLD
jgi:hypothetical protein